MSRSVLLSFVVGIAGLTACSEDVSRTSSIPAGSLAPRALTCDVLAMGGIESHYSVHDVPGGERIRIRQRRRGDDLISVTVIVLGEEGLQFTSYDVDGQRLTASHTTRHGTNVRDPIRLTGKAAADSPRAEELRNRADRALERCSYDER